MPHHVLFIQGAGEGAHAEDAVPVEQLHQALGGEYEMVYPAMVDEDNAPYDAWKQQIDEELASMQGPVFLVGHSIGGSAVAKYLAETSKTDQIAGVFLLAAPFWGGDGWRYDGYEELELPLAMAETVAMTTPIFLYHCEDDDIVPFDHLNLYQRRLTDAVGRVLEEGGHQFTVDLTPIVADIQRFTLPRLAAG